MQRLVRSRWPRLAFAAVFLCALVMVAPAPATAAGEPGTVVAWGNGYWLPTTSLTGVTAVSQGIYHGLALKSDGTVVGWGGSAYSGGAQTPPAGLTGVVAVAAGGAHSVALQRDGTVVGWGSSEAPPADLTGVVAIAAGYSHSLALKSDGTIVGWGDNFYGQATGGAALTGVTAIAAGAYHSVALLSDGSVVAWGIDAYGTRPVPAGLAGVTAIAAGGYLTLALKSDGTIVGWGQDQWGQATGGAALTGVTAIAAGWNHGLALLDNGAAAAWGMQYYELNSVPAGLTRVTAIAAGMDGSLALVDGVCMLDCYVDAAAGDDANGGTAQYPKQTITAGVDAVAEGGTVHVAAGTYDIAATMVVNKAVTIAGPASGIAKLQGINTSAVSIFEIAASNVNIRNLEITHNALAPGLPSPWAELPNSLIRIPTGGLSGIAITNNKIYVPAQTGAMSTWNGVGITVGAGAATGINISGNTIHNTRNGVVTQSNNTATVSNNIIYDTKGGIMNYTSGQADADNRTLAGNAWGTAHNEWDVVWNTGAYYLPTNRYRDVLGVSATNNGAYVLDRRAPDAAAEAALTGNRSHIFVDAASSVVAAHPARGNFNEPFQNLDLAWQAVIRGGTVYVFKGGTYNVSAGAHPGGVVVTGDGATINLNGATVGAGSPAFTIAADDVTLMGPGVLDGNHASSPAILVPDGADNFILDGVEIRNWMEGVWVRGAHASLKLVNNWIHNNESGGIRFFSDLALAGVVTINGNLLKDNTAQGITNLSTTVTVPAAYNSWGSAGGPTPPGDGVYGPVTDSPYTFAELFVDVTPDTAATVRNVNELDTFAVAVKVDAKGLYAVQYKLTYDPAYLTLQDSDGMTPGVQVADGAFKGSGSCTQTVTVGSVRVYCTRFAPDGDADGVLTVSTLTFKADGASRTGDGPWHTYLDLSVAGSELSSAARDGVKVYVNNGGFGAPSTTPGRTITDTPDDGQITIHGLANYTGYVDLQGRANDSGALFEVYNQASQTGDELYAGATTASSGKYTTSYAGTRQLVIGQTYWFQVDRALYLPTTAVASYPGSPAPDSWQHSKPLAVRPLQSVTTLVLLGGDATNDNVIESGDAGCIGGVYGVAPQVCGRRHIGCQRGRQDGHPRPDADGRQLREDGESCAGDLGALS